MAIAVASTSSNSGNNLESLIITAPTGITEGDLLLAVIAGGQSSGSISGFTTSSSFSGTRSGVSNDLSNGVIQYKYATSTDESATDYTATFSTDQGGAGVILRVTGFDGSADPLYLSSLDANQNTSSSGSAGASGLSLARPYEQLLLLVSIFGTEDNSAAFTTSNYAITSSDLNPSWTESIEASFITTFEPLSTSIAGTRALTVAYAVTTDTSTITAFSLDYVEGAGDPSTGTFGLFVYVLPSNATANISRLEVTPALYSPTTSNTATADVSRLDVTPELHSPETSSNTNRTRWTPTPKS